MEGDGDGMGMGWGWDGDGTGCIAHSPALGWGAVSPPCPKAGGAGRRGAVGGSRGRGGAVLGPPERGWERGLSAVRSAGRGGGTGDPRPQSAAPKQRRIRPAVPVGVGGGPVPSRGCPHPAVTHALRSARSAPPPRVCSVGRGGTSARSAPGGVFPSGGVFLPPPPQNHSEPSVAEGRPAALPLLAPSPPPPPQNRTQPKRPGGHRAGMRHPQGSAGTPVGTDGDTRGTPLRLQRTPWTPLGDVQGHLWDPIGNVRGVPMRVEGPQWGTSRNIHGTPLSEHLWDPIGGRPEPPMAPQLALLRDPRGTPLGMSRTTHETTVGTPMGPQWGTSRIIHGTPMGTHLGHH